MKKLIVLSAMCAASGVAQAAYITIDDFSIAQGPISDTVVDGNPVVNTITGAPGANIIGGSRTISSNMVSGIAPRQNGVFVDSDILDITNGVGDDSEVILSWNIAPYLLPMSAVNINISALVVQSDGNPMSVEFLLNGNSILSNFIPPNTLNTPLGFGVSLAALSGGGILTMKLNGAPGWDLAMDTLGIEYTTVPVPGSLALLGLGLAGLGFARRRTI